MTIERKMGMGIAGQPSGGAANVADVFSTYLYTGTGANRSIVNGIDLAGEGGMVWFKDRNTTNNHMVFDTERGVNKYIYPDLSLAQGTAGGANALKAFNSDGFDLGSFGAAINPNNQPIVSWTFRKAPKFFTCLTYTGNGVAGREIAHGLDGPVGMMFVKATSVANGWNGYHTSLGNGQSITLSSPNAAYTSSTAWNNTSPTDTHFTVGTNTNANSNGVTYVAYLFADNSAEDADDQMIKCGSYTATGNDDINLGWEPQFILSKRANSSGDWEIHDTVRGLDWGAYRYISPNTNQAESSSTGAYLFPTATGFTNKWFSGNDEIVYIAIRAPMMKKPSAGTEVFAIDTAGSTGDGVAPAHRSGFPVDFGMRPETSGGSFSSSARLTQGRNINTNSSAAEGASGSFKFDYMNGWISDTSTVSVRISYMWKRAKGYFDVVAYTGTGSPRTLAHSLGVVPEMIVCKSRSTTSGWQTYHKTTGNTKYLYWNQNYPAQTSSSVWNNTTPTDSVFTVGTGAEVNTNAATYIAYLFASVSGVSKVGSYTGNGSSQTLNCGFAAGARFILIKRTDAAGDWFYWDTTRGIVAGNDPHLSLNTTAAEVTTDDSVDPDNSGFIVNQVAATNINVSSVTYIYLAIA